MVDEKQEENTVTFETVRDAYRKERGSPNLQSIEPDFYSKINEYIARKKGELESAKKREGRFSYKLVKQHENELENAIMTLHQLSEIREKKILIRNL